MACSWHVQSRSFVVPQARAFGGVGIAACRTFRPFFPICFGRRARGCRRSRHMLLDTGACRAVAASTEDCDEDLVMAINEASNKCLRVMLANDEAAAQQLSKELQEMQEYLSAEQEQQASQFLGVLRSMLGHTLPTKAAAEADGRYRQAINRLCNQLQGSDWKLAEEGKEGSPPGSEEPRFSTWDEVMEKKSGQGSGGAKSQQQQQQQQPGSMWDNSAGGRKGAGPLDMAYYNLLGVPASASVKEIKAAYRSLALKLHPDVSEAPDATEQFAAVAQAYDTLSDETSRRLYDQYGPEGMKGRTGSAAGRGNAGRAWDEFKPFKRENKRTRARDASRASFGASFDDPEGGWGAESGGGSTSSSSGDDAASGAREGSGPALAVTGDVIEYPLGAVVIAELADGRSHGVGLLVGRNMDRGDAAKLPKDALDLCEVEPLRQEEPGSNRWIPDELSPPAFCRLGEVRQVPVASYDPRFDVWLITVPLSEGCGGPELGEEIMV